MKSDTGPVPPEEILKMIAECLDASKAWNKPEDGAEYLSSSFLYLAKAEGLIELMEVHNCGSTGGFDSHKGIIQSMSSKYHGNLRKRLKWLKEVR